MATASEKRALVFLAALAALGLSVRAVRSTKGAGGDIGGLDRQIASVDSATALRRAPGGERRPRAASKSRRPRTDSTAVADIRGDPRANPRRESGRGARPAAAPDAADDRLALYEARRRAVEASNAEARARLADRAAEREAAWGPPAAPVARPPTRDAAGRRNSATPVDMDTADEATIATVPWIGPTLAARIVADRNRRGSFGSLQALQRVAGIGPGLSSRIAIHVTFSRPRIAPPTVIRLRKSRP